MFIRLRHVPERTRTRSGACTSDTHMLITPTLTSADVNTSPDAWATLSSDEAIRPVVVRPGTLGAGILVGRRHFFSPAPDHRISSLLAAFLLFLHRAQFLLDQRCDSCLNAALPPTDSRSRAFGGLTPLEGFLPLPSEGYNISTARTSSMADLPLLRKFPLCLHNFYV